MGGGGPVFLYKTSTLHLRANHLVLVGTQIPENFYFVCFPHIDEFNERSEQTNKQQNNESHPSIQKGEALGIFFPMLVESFHVHFMFISGHDDGKMGTKCSFHFPLLDEFFLKIC